VKRWGMLMTGMVCCGLMAPAQQPATGQPPVKSATIARPATMTFDVAVTDKGGKPMTGLKAKDFTLLDNGNPASIESFAAFDSATPDPPESVIVMIDDVNTRLGDIMFARQQIGKFLTMHDGHLPAPVSLMLLTDSRLKRIAGPSQDGNLLNSDLEKVGGLVREVPEGDRNNAAERMDISLRALMVLGVLEARIPGRKLVIWVSPGWWMFDNATVLEWDEQQKSVFQTIVVTSQVLRAARITLDAVDPLGSVDANALHTYLWKSYVKPVTRWEQAQPADLSLQVLAAQSGGRVVSGGNDVAEELDACLDDARVWYAMTFAVPSAAELNAWRGVEVKVDEPDARVRTDNGYYAVPAR
jgi:VWFA-related protein